MEKNIYAPILIPTLCRDEHFVRCVESLKENTWAKYTDVYIALDYPVKEEHWNGYEKICEYLKGNFSEFASMNVIKRPYNYGSNKNMRELRNDIFKKYDRFIRADDDCEFSKNFLEYMDKCLDVYENDESVLGVTGYSYPLKWNVDEKYNAMKNSLIFPMWGTGFWKEKYITMQQDIEGGYIRNFEGKLRYLKRKMTNARYLNYINGKFDYRKESLTMVATDLACGCYMQLTNKFIITPVISKVRNWGFDGTGEFCQNIELKNKFNYRKQEIDKLNYFNPVVDEKSDFKLNKKIIDEFDYRTNKQIYISEIRFYLKNFLMKIWGKEKYLKNFNKRTKSKNG